MTVEELTRELENRGVSLLGLKLKDDFVKALCKFDALDAPEDAKPESGVLI